MWAALTVRDAGCAFPGCDAPTSRCDAHHITHWADGGPTALANLVLLCRYHHQRVLHDDQHQDRWSVRIDDDTGRPVFTPPTWTGRRGVPLPPLWQPDG
ncbi:MAG: HNH endonuclease signature motif containing protein [Actinomycetota bacterium]